MALYFEFLSRETIKQGGAFERNCRKLRPAGCSSEGRPETGNQIMCPKVCPSGLAICPVPSLAATGAMPCSAFAGQETWCARVHGFSRPRHSRLSEMSSFAFLRYRSSASRELRTRDHRNEATGQSPRYGASGMKRTVHIDACDLGATPPR